MQQDRITLPKHKDYGDGANLATSLTPYLALVVIMALSLALRLPYLSAPLTVDEGNYAYVAYWWQKGETLYRSVWVERPQGLVLLYALGMKLLGDSTEAIRLFGALYSSITPIFIFLIGARFLGRRLGILAALFFVLTSAHPRIEGFIPNAELYMILPATISAYYLFKAWDEEATGVWLFGAGVMAGVAFLIKQSGIVALFLAISYVFYQRVVREQAGILQILREEGAVLAGFAVILAPWIVQGLATAPVDYLDAITYYRWKGGSIWAYPIRYQLDAFLNSVAQVIPVLGIFLLNGWWAFIMGNRATGLYLWLFWSTAGMAIGGHWWPHYYMQITPPLAILSAQGVGILWGHGKESRKMAIMAGAMLGVGSVFVGHTVSLYLAPTSQERLFKIAYLPRYKLQDELVNYILEKTPEDSTIYSAYGGAEIIYRSRRLSAVKYLSFMPLFYIPGAYEEMLAILADPAKRPYYIITDPTSLEGPLGEGRGDNRFAQALSLYYIKEATFQEYDRLARMSHDFDIYRSKSSLALEGRIP